MVQRANKWLRQQAMRWKEQSRAWIVPIGILSLVYTLALSALLRADVNYIDDMGRVLLGYRGWENFSRFLSNFLAMFLHMGRQISDISPVPQILAAVLMSVAGVVVIYLVTGVRKPTVWQYAAVLLMGLSPYFLECFSYKFDAPYMALSVLASVLPLLVWPRSWKLYTLSCVVSILVVCTTYQASSGIFPMLVVLVALQRWNQKEPLPQTLRFFGLSVLGYGVGLIIFRVWVMTPVSDYVSNGLPALDRLPQTVLANYRQYAQLVLADARPEWLLAGGALVVWFVYVQVRRSQQNKGVAVLVWTVGAVVTGLLCLGLYPVLEQPLFQPRAMYGVGVWLAFLAVCVSTWDNLYVGKLATLALAWSLATFALSYGNWLAVQEEYTTFRLEQTIDSLVDHQLIQEDKVKTVQLTGSIGYAPALRNRERDVHLISRLVPITFGNSQWEWGRYQFVHNYGLEAYVEVGDEMDLTGRELPMVEDNLYHTIWADEECILIDLKE